MKKGYLFLLLSVLFLCVSQVLEAQQNTLSTSQAAPTGSVSYCAGDSSGIYHITPNGDSCSGTISPDTIYYQWQINGSNIAGATGLFNADSIGDLVLASGAFSSSLATSGIYSLSVTYSATANNCFAGTSFASSSLVVTVNPTPFAGTITGLTSVCSGHIITLSDSTAGGIWASSDSAIATVDSFGVVTNSTAGADTISYSVSNTCGTAVATYVITINPLPPIGAITGGNSVCLTYGIILLDSIFGGSWSTSAPSIAWIDSTGIVYGDSIGSALISYTITDSNGCTSVATDSITVITTLNPGTITGSFSVCSGASDTLMDTVSGGVWSSVSRIIATVNSEGVLTALIPGTDTVQYTFYNTCGYSSATAIITVMPLPTAGTITSIDSICTGSSLTLAETVPGGSWSVSNSNVSLVGNVITGAATGLDTVIYSVTSVCGFASVSQTVTILTLPSTPAITGDSAICAGSTATFTGLPTGGGWSLTNTTAASDSINIITAITAGTDTVQYTITNYCGSVTTSQTITVNSVSSAGYITGPSGVCLGNNITFADSAGSVGSWYASNANATIDTSGSSTMLTVTGMSAGVDTISYTTTGICSDVATYIISINPLPYAGTITGGHSVCQFYGIILLDAVAGGVWSSSAPSIASVDSTGIVSGIATGNTTITYTITDINGCTSYTTDSISVITTPDPGAISGTLTLCTGSSDTLTETVSGGAWFSVTTTVANISSTGVVSAITAGTDTIEHSLSNTCGISVATAIITVQPLGYAGAITSGDSICTGASLTLAETVPGGSWSVSNSNLSLAGNVITGGAIGTDTLTYSVTSVCGAASVSQAVTILTLPSPPSITGDSQICSGSATTFTGLPTGGAWSLTNTTIASDSLNIITAITAGTDTVQYSITNFCGSATASQVITVDAIPVAGYITGSSGVCLGNNITLTDSAGSAGTWSASNANVTIDSTGSSTMLTVTGLTVGIDTISYTTTGVCNEVATFIVTINPLPSAGSITGGHSVCMSYGIILLDAVSGGVWSSSAPSSASIDSTGIVTGISTGASTITYSVTDSRGCTSYSTDSVSVITTPDPGSISGTMTLCAGATDTLTDTISGGGWSSVSAGIASINSTGIVSAISAGTDTIEYSLYNTCGTSLATAVITVMPLPTAGTVTSTDSICTGSSLALAETVSGGSWSVSNSNLSLAGNVITGAANGIDTIIYAVTTACGSASVSQTVTILTLPATPAITGDTAICAGSTATFTGLPTGGVWSMTNSTLASDSLNIITAITAGTDTVQYTITNYCGSVTTSQAITVNAISSAGYITGPSGVCVGNNITVVDSAGSVGSWSASNANATIDTSGSSTMLTVTGMSAGVDTISYTATGVCSEIATYTISINPLPNAGTITGGHNVCMSYGIILLDAVTGGIWSSSAPSVASVDSTGIVSGIATGNTTITYTITDINGCTSYSTDSISVITTPDPGTISGTLTLCTGSSDTLTETVSGGAWFSVTITVAYVGSTGIVSAISAGTDTIEYSLANTCGTSVATVVITVQPLGYAGTITSADSICTGSSLTLAETVPGGSWSVSNSNLFLAGNVITGGAIGTDTLTYSVTSVCGAASVSQAVTILTLPSPPSITGDSAICAGSTTTFTGLPTGGVWSLTNTTLASDSFNVITAITAGTDTVQYSVANYCGSAIASQAITINSIPAAGYITGSSSVCLGNNITLTDSAGSAGTWSASNTNATIVASGSSTMLTVTGISAGVDTISYTTSGPCAEVATFVITVNTLPYAGYITGGNSVCLSYGIILLDSISGGTWSSSSTSVASVDSTGIVYGDAVGNAIISYGVTDSNGCTAYATDSLTVMTTINPGVISGSLTICMGSTGTLTDTVSGGGWSSAATGIAHISASGTVTPISAGVDTILYTLYSSCGYSVASAVITVVPTGTAGVITSGDSLCVGGTLTLSETLTGGIWSVSNSRLSLASGVISGLTTGLDTLQYAVTTICGAATASKVIHILSLPSVPSLTGDSLVCSGTSATITASPIGGSWSETSPFLAVVSDSSIVIRTIFSGIDTVHYTVSNYCGTSGATHTVTINSAAFPGYITGPSSVCIGTSISLTDSAGTPSGAWSASNTNATISSSGVVAGLVAGTDTVTYATTGLCSGIVTMIATINPLPYAGIISGGNNVCLSYGIILLDSIPGGIWSSSNTGVAPIDSTGIVSGSALGTSVISYSITDSNGCTNFTTDSVSVITLPAIGVVSGSLSVCAGSTTTLSDSVSGGGWASVSTGVAHISSGGVVTAMSAGTDTIQYGLSNMCGVSVATAVVTVLPLHFAGSILAADSVCLGSVITLGETVPGGTWSVSNSNLLLATNVITGENVGFDTITYSVSAMCGIGTATKIIHVITTLPIPAISGESSVCVGSAITFTGAPGGGVWSVSNPAIASSSGNRVTGISAGIDTVWYTRSNVCGNSAGMQVITVNPTPWAGYITGASSICAGSVQILNDSAGSSGSWSASNSNVAIDSFGSVTGIVSGQDTIYYTTPGVCGQTASFIMNVHPLPDAGIISGSKSVCLSSGILLSETVTGGVWSSSASGIAIVDSTGVVYGAGSGSAAISYSVTSSALCTSYAVDTIAVVSVIDSGIIYGTTSICVGGSATLADSVAGGIWSSGDTTIVIIDSATGFYTAVGQGGVTIDYTVTNACGSQTANTTITVLTPPYIAPIYGSMTVCAGSTITLTDASSGGYWSSVASGIAVVDSYGIVTSFAGGTDTIKYNLLGDCGISSVSAVITINAIPVAGVIFAADSICTGTTDTLAETASGGIWSVSNRAASLSSGTITGAFPGIDTLTYTITNPCGVAAATAVINVLSVPATPVISGDSLICAGFSVTFSGYPAGGVWSLSDSSIAGNSSNIINTFFAGIDSVHYAVSNLCGSSATTAPITIDPMLSAGYIVGPAYVCEGGTITLGDSLNLSSGNWSASNYSATISPSGIVTAIYGGIDTISFTTTGLCNETATVVITVYGPASAGIITGGDSVCIGSSVTLSGAVYGGTWSVTNTNAVSLDSIIIGASTGTDTILYTISSVCGPLTDSFVLRIDTIIAPVITGSTISCLGGIDTLIGSPSGGAWATTNANATISGGVVTGIAIGPDTVLYTVINACGIQSAYLDLAVYSVHDCDSLLSAPDIKGIGAGISVYPNPNTGRFAIDIAHRSEKTYIRIIDIYGQVVRTLITTDKQTDVDLGNVARGTYMLEVTTGEKIYREKIVVW